MVFFCLSSPRTGELLWTSCHLQEIRLHSDALFHSRSRFCFVFCPDFEEHLEGFESRTLLSDLLYLYEDVMTRSG